MKTFKSFSIAETLTDLDGFLDPKLVSMSYDTETHSTTQVLGKNGKPKTRQPMHNSRIAKVRLHQFYHPSVNDGRPVIVDMFSFPFKDMQTFLKQLFWERRGLRIYVHNAIFDGDFVFGEYGVFPYNIVCTKIMSTLFFAGLYQGLQTAERVSGNKVHSLAGVYARLFPGSNPVDKTLQSSDWGKKILSTEQYEYASYDTVYGYQVGERLYDLIVRSGLDRVYQHETDGLRAFIACKVWGMPICINTLNELKSEYSAALDKLLEQVRHSFNTVVPLGILDEYHDTFKQLIRQFIESYKIVKSYLDSVGKTNPNQDRIVTSINKIIELSKLSFNASNTTNFNNYQIIYNIEIASVKKCIDALFNAAYIKDQKHLKTQLKDITNNLDKIVKLVYGFTELNPSSPPQMKLALNRIGFNVGSTGAGVLSNILNSLSESESDEPLVADDEQLVLTDLNINDVQRRALESLILYRSVKAGYGYIKLLIDSYNSKTGRVHGDFNPMGSQGTGRSTCLKPTLQIIPRCPTSWVKLGLRAIRIAFRNIEIGWKIASLDSAGCHTQIARRYSQDRTLIYNVQNDKDNYITLGVKMLEIMGDPMTHDEIKAIIGDKKHPRSFEFKEMRQAWKKVYLSRLNGAGANKIYGELLDNDPPIRAYDFEMVKLCCNVFDETFPDLARTQKILVENANSDVIVSPYGAYQTYSVYFNNGNSQILTTNKYGVAKSLDGGRYYLPVMVRCWDEEKLDTARESVKNTEVLAFSWQRVEGSCVKTSSWKTVLYILENGLQDKVQLCNINHDEQVLTGEMDVFPDVVVQANQYIEDTFRIYVPDYTDRADPLKKILDNWQEKE